MKALKQFTNISILYFLALVLFSVMGAKQNTNKLGLKTTKNLNLIAETK